MKNISEQVERQYGRVLQLLEISAKTCEAADDMENVVTMLEEARELVETIVTGGPDIQKILEEVQAAHPDEKLFYIDTPYHGVYVIKEQDMNVVNVVGKAVDKFIDDRIKAEGGTGALEAMSKDAQQTFYRTLNEEAGDVNNNTILTECVLYPYDFTARVAMGKLPGGLYINLLDRISEISCFHAVEVREV